MYGDDDYLDARQEAREEADDEAAREEHNAAHDAEEPAEGCYWCEEYAEEQEEAA